MSNALQLGSILVSSWGYDQTNVNAYQVVGFTKSGKSARLREISTQTVPGSEGFMSCTVVPVADSFIGEVFTKRIKGDAVAGPYSTAILSVGWSPCEGCGGELTEVTENVPKPQLACESCGAMFEGEKRKYYSSWYA